MTIGDKTVFLYVGPHKSGTFFLRDQIFPFVNGLYDVRTRDMHIIDLLIDAMAENPLFLDIDRLKDKIAERLRDVDESVIVISDPDFFGSYEGMADLFLYYSKQFADNEHKTSVLKQLFPDAKIILTPRRQDTWVESYYRGVLKSAQTVSLSDFLEPRYGSGRVNTSRAERPACDLSTLDWGVYVAHYHNVFGRENVLVVPNEMLLKDTTEALTRLYAFMGVDPYVPNEFKRVNRGYSARACRIALALNRFVRSPNNRLGIIPNRPFFQYLMARRDRGPLFRMLAGLSSRLSLHWFLTNVIDRYFRGSDDLLSADEREKILEMFRSRNRSYATLIDFDLARYGYY